MNTSCLVLRVVLFACVTWTLASPAGAVAWVARHGLTAAQYQAEFDKWTGEGLRLRCVGGYSEGGSARYAAVWDNSRQTPWIAHHAMSAADVDSQVATYTPQSFRLKFINMHEVGGQIEYAAIWEASSQLTTHRLGRSWSQFQADHSSLSAQGYQLASMSSCNFETGFGPVLELYSGVWALPDPFGHIQQERFRLTGAQYQAEFEALAGQGYRLVCVTSCTVSGSLRYSSIWRKPFGPGWWSFSSLRGSDYQTETENAVYQGCRTEYVSVHMSGGEPRFNAVWTGNGGMPFECIGILDQGIRQFMQDNDTPGVSIAIMKNGRLVFAKGYGQSDHVTGELAGPLHRYRIASIAKPVTAAAILQLAEDTSLGLDDLVFGPGGTALGTQYGNGNYSNWERQITVRHLLTHRTGWTAEDPLWDNSYGQDHDAVMEWTLDSNSPSSQPGTMYQYMNLDYHVLGRIIEEYSGQTYENYCRNSMLNQCGITTMELGERTLAGRKSREVRYYDPSRDPYVDIDPERMDANGGWIATPIDLLLFLRRIDDASFPSDILNSASRTAMRTGTAQNANYGLGWSWDGARTWEGHNGCMTGTSSFLVNRDDGVAYAVLANKRTSCSWELKAAIDPLIDQLEAKNAWPTYNLFPPGTDYRSWVRLHFSAAAASLIDTGLLEYVGPNGDPDGDKLVNAAEKYFGTDPGVANPSPVTIVRDRDEVVLRWPCVPNSGYTAEPRFSYDLEGWFSDARAAVEDVSVRGAATSIKQVRLPASRGGTLFSQLAIGEE